MSRPLRLRLLRLLNFSDPGHPCVVRAHHLRRDLLRSDERLCKHYLRSTSKPKLHVGGGWRRLDGWLNTDLQLIPSVMRMDATERFPFPDEVFEYVYAEHMIEHVPYEKGAFMLRECYRVMRRGGVIRVVTPDLAVILGLYNCKLSADQQRYLAWLCEAFIPEQCPSNAVFVINAMFRLWGHQFIYDEETLTESMHTAGFRSIRRLALGESKELDLQNMDNEQRYPAGLLNFESVALEGLKSDVW
jgi:predicted SAM-dependent methyltransferase